MGYPATYAATYGPGVMADSLIIAESIELLGRAVSTLPQCPGAVFTLAPGFDLGVRQPSTSAIASMLDGERVTGRRSSNRTVTLPVVIQAPDRLTLAAARETLLQITDDQAWELKWTRDQGAQPAPLPMILDCSRAQAAVVAYSLTRDKQFVSNLTVTFEAAPYGRSDTLTDVALASPLPGKSAAPAPVVLDNYSTVSGTGWTQSGLHVVGPKSAHWTPTSTPQAATYTRTFTAVSIAGRPSLSLWLGEAYDLAHWAYSASFTKTVTFAVVLQDAAGHTLSFGASRKIPFSNGNTPVWTLVTVPIPQGSATFGYTNLVKYTLTLGNFTGYIGSTYRKAVLIRVQPYLDALTANPPSILPAAPIRGAVYQLLGVGGTARTPLSLQFQQAPYSTPITQTFGTPGGYTWVCPPGVTSALVENTGGGGYGSARSPAGVTPYVICSKSAAPGSTVVSTAVTTPSAAGDAITIAVGSNGGAISSVGDTKGNVYSFVKSVVTGALTTSVYQALNTAALAAGGTPDLVTVTFTSSTSARNVAVIGCAGVLTASAVDQVPNGTSGSSTAPTITSGTLAQSSEVCIAVETNSSGGGPITWGSGFTGLVSLQNLSTEWTAVAYKTVAATAAVTASGTIVSNSWEMLLVTLKLASAGFGGGAGGGEYASEPAYAVEPGRAYGVVVGAGGTAASVNGGDSYFDGPVGVAAHGGTQGGGANAATGGPGGTGSLNTTHHDGGAGGTGTTAGGGGGSSGGTAAAGNAGTGAGAAGAAVAGGGIGGVGATVANNPGVAPASGPGGGGGGSWSSTAWKAGGNGANGQVKITYTGSIAPFSTLIAHCPGPDAPPDLSPLVTFGAADVPNGGTEYPVASLVPGVYADFGGTYSVVIVAYTWDTPANPRTVTLTVRQYEYQGGPSCASSVTRTFTPASDITNGITVLGELTLPLKDVALDNSAGYYSVTVTDTNTADRFLDCLFLDTMGSTVIVNVPAAGAYTSYYIDEPAPSRGVGRVLGSSFDRAQAVSVLDCCPVLSGGPLTAYPGDNLLVAYCLEGAPALGVTYFARYFLDRTS